MSGTTIHSNSVKDTAGVAEEMAAVVKAGDIILLCGDLGAGKTVFVQAFTKALGCHEEATSPSFTLLKEYRAAHNQIFHFDAYRLEGIRDFIDLGYRDYLFDEGISIIEWGEKIETLVGDDYLVIKIVLTDETNREITIIPHGKKWDERIERLWQR